MIPENFVAGTTFDRLLTLIAYPAPDWEVMLFLRGPVAVDVTGVAEGSQHRLAAAAAVTSDWLTGLYLWSLRATREGEVLTVDEGRIRIAPDVAAIAGAFDPRSHARKVLDAIEAVIEGRATIDQQKYTINNRELWRTPIADLLLLRSRYRDEERREKRAGRHGQSLLGRQVKVRI